MEILLPWEIDFDEEEYLRSNLSSHSLRILKSKKTQEIISNVDLTGTDVLIAGLASGPIIESCRNLKLIQSMISGVSHIDLRSAYRNSIPTASCKGANSRVVAEHATMLILNLLKNSKKHFQNIQEGVWSKLYSEELYGKTLGIIGYGNIGSNVAHFVSGFGLKVNAIRKRPYLGDHGVRLHKLEGKKGLQTLLQESDIILISVPKTSETLGMINESTLREIKKGSYLVNISRGPIVKEEDLYEELVKGNLSGYATDVYSVEPNNFKSRIYTLPNVICTPHIAASVKNAKIKCLEAVVENINLFNKGKTIKNLVDYDLGY